MKYYKKEHTTILFGIKTFFPKEDYCSIKIPANNSLTSWMMFTVLRRGLHGYSVNKYLEAEKQRYWLELSNDFNCILKSSITGFTYCEGNIDKIIKFLDISSVHVATPAPTDEEKERVKLGGLIAVLPDGDVYLDDYNAVIGGGDISKSRINCRGYGVDIFTRIKPSVLKELNIQGASYGIPAKIETVEKPEIIDELKDVD